ncbi:hypothetical protein HS088_TW12G00487 [Tripterygium wilfordii]|uniref:C2 NT-type domain-containing protein n=1 Tax=Tripterygium wilfordii TaxID=458696 RepID=A0A7J7CYX8_TRIWF|nr:protein PLASTID MOVEMENT IMPAIRED 1-like [Tripterygium wilfordii]KAF5739284.1 hypothetical protein HS088_TW12G00487 [Tripterygium wilfordii]
MAANSNTQLLEELESLSQSLFQTHISTTKRRTASFAAPRTSVPFISAVDEIKTAKNEEKSNARSRSRRMSLSPWRSKPNLDDEDELKDQGKVASQPQIKGVEETTIEKKGIWNWKPIRALSHIGMQKLSCLFSVEVVTVQGLPSSMNGLRLSVRVRKKETKEGAVNTMPSRVSQGAADFEETLFVKCHVYCTPPGNGNQMKFESRPFWIYVFAVDAEELDFGRSSVDLSHLIQESIQKSFDNSRIRQWDMSFDLSGKAKEGELVLKLGFQIMGKDGGTGIYTQAEGLKSNKSKYSSTSFGRKQSKTSFSIPSPRMTNRSEAWTPSMTKAAADLQGMDVLNLDEPVPVPAPAPPVKKSEKVEPKMEDDIPDFEVVDKGIEIQENEETGEDSSEANTDVKSASSEVVKEIVHDHLHLVRLTELDSIAQQIKALESMMGEERTAKMEDETGSQRLDEEEETVTKGFLQMLEEEDAFGFKLNDPEITLLQLDGADNSTEAESKVHLPQTRDGGYLAAMNPTDTLVERKDTPRLAMQMSKPMVIQSHNSANGFELFQNLAAIGPEEFSSQIFSLMPMDELIGKTAEQIAFEGIASAIIQGRNKEGASSSAARIIAAVKNMATAMSTGRSERISTGIWNVKENPLRAEEILAFSLQKIEAMAVEALKVQADMSEEDAPFDVSLLSEKGHDRPLDSAVPLEDWIKRYSLINPQEEAGEPTTIFLAVVVQLRDPLRRYEAVGGPAVALIHARYANTKLDKYDEEKRFKVTSSHIGGLKVSTGGKKNLWDSERQRLTAMQWLVEYGLGKAGKKRKPVLSRGQDLLWSISSRVMADMWLKAMRNPDVRFAN